MNILTKAKNVLSLVDGLDFEEKHVALRADDVIVVEPEPLMKMYPNPIAGTLNLEYTQNLTEVLQVQIYNVLSNELIYEGNMETELFTLDVSSWQTGFYSIIVLSEEGEQIFISSTMIKN